MIEVIIKVPGRMGHGMEENTRIRILNVDTSPDGELGNYEVQITSDSAASIAMHRRGVLNFPRLKYNVLALLLQALNTLDEEDLSLDESTAGYLARRLGRGVQEVPDQEERSGGHH